jgi:hypothetical protein
LPELHPTRFLGVHVVPASAALLPLLMSVLAMPISLIILLDHRHLSGSLGHGINAGRDLGDILSRARHHLCGSRREDESRKRCGNNQALDPKPPLLGTTPALALVIAIHFPPAVSQQKDIFL